MRKQQVEETGYLYAPSRKLKKAVLTDCLSTAALEDGWIINKDGSLAQGFELTLFEEEQLSEDELVTVAEEFAAAAQRLPIATSIQKLDIYWEETFKAAAPNTLPFFYRKTLAHHDGKTLLKHRCVLFLRFFGKEITPLNNFLALGNKLFKTPFDDLEAKKKQASSAAREFVAAIPTGIQLSKLDDKANEQLLYQYTSLTFDRKPIGFERTIVWLPDATAMGVYVKSVKMKREAAEVYHTGKHDLGAQGVTMPFTWSISHFARFPHIVAQHIEIIQDKKFRKAKGLEMEYSAQLSLQARERALAADRLAQLVALEKTLNEQATQIVKMSLQVLAWHPDKEILQQRVDYIKSALGKLGMEAVEEAEETTASFLAHVPGGVGFLAGCYMPLETAVAHLNFITPRKGDQQGIILQDRHGAPILYDPFKYTLDNQHVFLFGPSGSGKSFFNGKMIKDRYYQGHTVVVIDSGGTYRFLFQALGGRYIEYNPDTPLRLNPFLIKRKGGKYIPDTDKIAFLVNFLAKMWKGDLNKNPLTAAEYALLSKFLTFYYQSLAGEAVPNLIGFCQWLKGHIQQEDIARDLFDAPNFFIVLEPFTAGIYQDHFNAFELAHLEDSRLLCFELEAVKNDRRLYPLVVQVLFDYILQLVANQPEQKKFIDIEEGWSMLDDASESYIAAFFRKGRKTNTAIRIITQSVEEIRASKIAGAMKNNAATFILLYNDKASVRQDIAAFLGMDAFDMEKYASLRRRDSYVDGYREVFIKEMDHAAVWRIGMSLFEHGLLTSRPDERNHISELLKAGGNLRGAVSAWVNKISTEEEQRHGTYS